MHGEFLPKSPDSGKTFSDISVNTDQIRMWFYLKQMPWENDSNTTIFSEFQTKIWLKVVDNQPNFSVARR